MPLGKGLPKSQAEGLLQVVLPAVKVKVLLAAQSELVKLAAAEAAANTIADRFPKRLTQRLRDNIRSPPLEKMYGRTEPRTPRRCAAGDELASVTVWRRPSQIVNPHTTTNPGRPKSQRQNCARLRQVCPPSHRATRCSGQTSNHSSEDLTRSYAHSSSQHFVHY